MRRVRYASTNDIRYTGVWASLFRFIRWRCVRPACECVPFRVAIERIVNR